MNRFVRRLSTAALLCTLVAPRARAQRAPDGNRVRVNLDSGWLYLANDTRDAARAATVPPAQWARVNLPHTWNATDATDEEPEYRRAASWYRRSLDLAPAPDGRRFVLRFEAANTVADVYVNGVRAGGHVGGYVGFDVDITPFARAGEVNDLLVRVDNSDRPELIPSDKSDFVIYGGLTRDVWLETQPAVAVERLQVRTPAVSRERATTIVTVTVRNPARRMGAASLDAEVIDDSGSIAAHARVERVLSGDTNQVVVVTLPAIRNPRLWSPDSPVLYTLVVTLRARAAPADRIEERIGYRWYSFEPHGPFMLNGRRLLLRGTHRHEEAAGYGAAMPNAMHRADVAAIKAMGANFVRLAHYPQDPEVYRAADSLGLLIWDELPWCRGGVGDSLWRANTRRLLTEQIRQNVDHPSIILWSLGNEVADLVTAPNRGDVASLRAVMTELNAIAHELDPGRPTATRKFDDGADIVDVYSPSIWVGWYKGVYRDYEKALAEAHDKWPRFVHMEYGADAHAGRHSEHPITGEGLRVEPGFAEEVGKAVRNLAREGDWSESYQTDLVDWHLMVSERLPWLTGSAQWAFRDFATPLRPEDPIPYMNQKGLVDRSGAPKDAYFVYKSYWTRTPKFAYIVSHSWTERAGPRGKPRQLRVYSNCDSVELRAGGASQGIRRRDPSNFPAQGLRWEVGFVEGTNTIVATCAGSSPDERGVQDSLDVHYTFDEAGKPDHIALSTHPLANGRLLVEALLVDGKGKRSLGAADRVYFSVSGAGQLAADLGTPTGSRVIEAANGRAAIEVIPPPAGERGAVLVRTQAINGTRIEIDPATTNAGAPRSAAGVTVTLPDVIMLRGENLAAAKRRVLSGDTVLLPAYRRLLADAQTALRAGPFSVTSNKTLPASGDKHDYYSLAPYWWPDSTKPGGLPYVRHDGRVNPESRIDNDEAPFVGLADAVETLGLAYYFTVDAQYADRAVQLLRVFFLDTATRMTPNLRFAQAIRGVTDGRGIGIIGTRDIARIIDGIRLIQGARTFTAADRAGLHEWCRAYLNWLRTSPNGRDEAATKNNHVSWYDVQLASLALFVGDTATAREVAVDGGRRLVDTQIDPAGREPLELARTRSLSYSFFNVEALSRLAEIGRHVGANLWSYRAPSGASLLGAIRFLAASIVPGSTWAGEQITPVRPEEFFRTLWRAASVSNDTIVTRALATIPDQRRRDDRSRLFYPEAR